MFCFLFLWPAVHEQSLWLFSVTSVYGPQIKNSPWNWYSHNIALMIKMLNQNTKQTGTRITGLGIMIGKCSTDSQHGRLDRYPANVGCSFFKYTDDDLTNPTNKRRKSKAWTRKENQLAQQWYFKSNHTQRGYKKRMIGIWQECLKFSDN